MIEVVTPRRRVKILQISGNLMVQMFQYGWHPAYIVTENYLPDDAVIVDARFDGFRDLTELLIRSESYEEIDDAHAPPSITACPIAMTPPKNWSTGGVEP